MHIKKISALTASFILTVSVLGCGSSTSSNQLDSHNSEAAIVNETKYAEYIKGKEVSIVNKDIIAVTSSKDKTDNATIVEKTIEAEVNIANKEKTSEPVANSSNKENVQSSDSNIQNEGKTKEDYNYNTNNEDSQSHRDNNSYSQSNECNHNWVEQTRTIHHNTVSHAEPVYEDVYVVDKQEYNEMQYSGKVVCNQCNQVFTVPEMNQHLIDSIEAYRAGLVSSKDMCQSYHNEIIIIHHDAEGHYEKRQVDSVIVIDSYPYDETVSDGYVCSKCGESK